MIVAQTEARARTISKEERGLLAKTLDDTLDAIVLEQAIADAPRSRKDAAGRTWQMGDTLGKLVRNLLKLWEGKGQAEDDSIHKTMPELVLELRSTERKIRTAVRVGVEEGIIEVNPGYRPSDRRQTNFYTLNLVDTSLVAYRSEAARIRGVLERERRTGHRRSLTAKLRKLEAAISDLELRFLDPDEAAHDGFAVCERCRDEFCDGDLCLYTEDAHGWHDQDAPEFTDADAPEEPDEPEWLPQDFATGDPDDNLADYPSQSVSLTPAICQPTPDNLYPLQKTTAEEEPQKNTPFQVVATALTRRTPPPDIEEDEEQAATSSPPVEDGPGSGMAEKVTRPIPSVKTAQAPTRTVRDLLEPGGELHGIVDDALAWGEQAAPILARYVCGELGGTPEQHVGAVKTALMAMWKTEKEVA